jgi:cellulose synthase/poly-beta-1,6-N-acetylglucosamine synthase-like glycosyltransferase
VYDAVGGFAPISHSVSGDDDLFLQLIHRELGAKIHFATDPAVRVETDPPESWRAFFRQRLRHLSAGKYYSLPAKVIYAFFHLSQSLLLLFPLGFFSAHWAVYFVSFFILQGALDVLLFKSIQTTYGVSFSLPLALLWEYFYLAETWLIGPLSWIVPVGWKDSVQPVGDHAH